MKYQLIDNYRSEFPVMKMCETLTVSKSGYYDWKDRPISQQTENREKLKDKIRFLFFEIHGEMAGSPTITRDLQDYDEYRNVHQSRVASLMKVMGLRSKTQRKFVATTDSEHSEPIADNVLNRNFNPEKPQKYIVGDITYLKVASHFVYLTVFIDLFSRKVVSWDISDSLAAKSTCKAFEKYIKIYGAAPDILVHSDRGIQYASKEFRNILKSINATQSMSRKGNCWDNAVAESFFHTLKTRLTRHRKYDRIEELERDIFWYIEIYYNRVRKHSANNWLTPEQKESNFYKEQLQVA